MPEDDFNSTRFNKSSCSSSLLSIFLDSLKIIFLHNLKLFFTLYTFTTLPLSILITSGSLTTRFLKSHIARLQWLVNVVPIWMEAANVHDESRIDISILLRRKFLHGVPVFAFALIALVTTVTAAHACLTRRKVSLKAVLSALKVRWAPPLLTSLVNFIAWVAWAHLDPVVNNFAVKYPYVTAVQVAVEVYMMAVMGLALVVSVIEGRAGFEAVWVGWCLIKGRRLCGWVLSGLILMISGFIGRGMIGVMNGEDSESDEDVLTWTAEMRFGSMVGLVVFLGWFVSWSYVIFVVLYNDCRKRNVIRDDEQQYDIIVDTDL